MLAEEVLGQLTALLGAPLDAGARRRIVMWYDAEGEFSEDFSLLASDGLPGVDGLPRRVRLLKAIEGDMFSVKRLLCREDQESDFVVYRQRSSGCSEGDWLADIALYADVFQADSASLLLGSLGAEDTTEMRRALRDYRPFFGAKDRVAWISQAVPGASTRKALLCGALAYVLGRVAPEPEAIVQAWVLALDRERESEKPGQLESALERFGIADDAAAYLEALTGYAGSLSDADALASHFLLSALAATVPADVMAGSEGRFSSAHGRFCLSALHGWMDQAGKEDREDLAALCERVADARDLAARFGRASIDSLMQSDVFPLVDEVLLGDLMDSVAAGADRRADIRAVVDARKNLSWYDRVACYYDALDAAGAMDDFRRSHGDAFHLTSPEQVWRSYVDDWWRMDAFYRRFCTAFRSCSRDGGERLGEVSEALAEAMDNLYENWFLSEANGCWMRTAEDSWARGEQTPGVPLLRSFYDEVVEPEAAGGRCVVLISDGLRYEVARDLSERLERETRGSVAVQASQAPFPSVTALGMAALLPHRALSLGEKMEVRVDGLPAADTAQREAALQVRRPTARAVRSVDLVSMRRADRKEFARGAEVIYVYHNRIDAAGETASTSHDVFRACQDAVDDLVDLVRMAGNDLSASRIVVTADHGFLYTRRPLQEHERVSLGEASEDALCAGERYAVVRESCGEGTLMTLSLAELGEGLVGLAPRGFARFRRPGPAGCYAHGGASLQELCVPVLRVRLKRAGSKSAEEARYASLQVVQTERRITSAIFSLRLGQSEPVQGRVKPCVYDLVLVDADGNEVSDVRAAAADRTSVDAGEREMTVRFTLREGLSYSASEPYYLVARRKGDPAPVWREEFRVEMAFAPTIDFGF